MSHNPQLQEAPCSAEEENIRPYLRLLGVLPSNPNYKAFRETLSCNKDIKG